MLVVNCPRASRASLLGSWGMDEVVSGGMKRHATAFSVPTRSWAEKKLQDHLPTLDVCDAT